MAHTNCLRTHRKSIKEFFVHEFASIGEDLDYYVHVALPQNWIKSYGNINIRQINVSDYEETLINFIENPDSISSTHPLLIIIGGAGTGKSTTIKYSIKTAKVCTGCPHLNSCKRDFPARILIDFLDFKYEASAHAEVEFITRNYESDLIDRFWSHIGFSLSNVIRGFFNIEMEISDFWKWLLSGKYKGRHSHIFNNRLDAFDHLLENPKENKIELVKKREELYKSFSLQERVYYKLYQIAFLRQQSNANCNLLIFDNIDRLDPGIQTELINFALEANSAFGCKSIIPMRPHTFHLNRDAANCIEVIEHFIPDIESVLNARLLLYQQKGNLDVYLSMKSIVTEILSNATMKEVFYQSAGNSIRFAIRNLYNLFLSNLIVTHIDGVLVTKIEFNSSTFFQALFCSEGSDAKLFENNFVNILSLNKQRHLKEASNIKLRALHYLNINVDVEVTDLFEHLLNFGYSENDILTVINEFLDNKKPLIWSNSLLEFNSETIRLRKRQRFNITPMGMAYINILISHPSYLFECVYAIEGNYRKSLNLNLSNLFELLKQLFDKDINETKEFCLNSSVDQYKSLYATDLPSISSILFFKMHQNFSHLARNFPYDKFDVFGNYIVKEINDLLTEIENKKLNPQ